MCNMFIFFEIKWLNYIQLEFSFSIYFNDLILKWRNNHLFTIIFNDIKQNFLSLWMILIWQCLIQYYSLDISRINTRHLAKYDNIKDISVNLSIILINRQLLSRSWISYSTRRIAKKNVPQTQGNQSDE